ncbi:MAG TPA: leucine--tRNA ligase [Candidatus Polarisedimenticolia bacterium]|nr:leucine--tRNA ligase [Candidatus Polarisedimenticolia bacterium]
MNGDYRDQFDALERSWQERWERERLWSAPQRPTGRKYYALEMLPYPSGRLHMGHVRNYSIGDAVARFRRMRGDAVLHPMGWDSFGMPAENAAIQRGIPPAKWTTDNIATMRAQLRRLGFGYDWGREIAAHRPDYYRWNQWFFLRMLERDLAYRSRREVNWCDSCKTVLANEQVEGGKCWRCDSVVGKRELDQWFLRISRYSEELVAGLDRLPAWPEAVRSIQENWIGRSIGAIVRFPLVAAGGDSAADGIEIFTTRLDTIYGATFSVVARGHPILARVPAGSPQAAALEELRREVAARREQGHEEETAKRGVDTGLQVRNPYSGESIPLWAGNFVLMGYGTGAIMAVPGHDERDFEFATRYGLNVRVVVESRAGSGTIPPRRDAGGIPTAAMTADGVLVNSGPYNGLGSATARARMVADGAKDGRARESIQYRLLDWGISRQRYWGTPIPVLYCDRDGVVPVPDQDLPVILPEDVPLTGTGGSPLAQSASFVTTTCPRCGGSARRETDTMDTFIDSSWYFYRYCDARNTKAPFDPAIVAAWFPIDLYIGGINQAHLHLIYARFFTRVLRDLGLVTFDEPVVQMMCQGMVLKGGTAMSKSKGNIVDPDELIRRYGADTTRLFTLFAAPPEKDLEWDDQGVEGCFRFLERVWRLFAPRASALAAARDPGPKDGADEPRRAGLRRKVHRTIQKVTHDLDRRLHLNTPVSSLMELLNETADVARQERAGDEPYLKEAGRTLALLLQPLAPHVSEALWEGMGGSTSVLKEPWPEADPFWLTEDEIDLVVQVNGRLRGHVRVAKDAPEADAVSRARADARIATHLEGKDLRKTIYLPGRLLNLVVQ